MSGDCDWLDSFTWVKTVADYEAERAQYNARQQRLQDEREQREADEYQARVYDAEQAVEYAVSVLGAARVVELVSAQDEPPAASPAPEYF